MRCLALWVDPRGTDRERNAGWGGEKRQASGYTLRRLGKETATIGRGGSGVAH